MGFACAGRSDEMNRFGAIDELQFAERHDAAWSSDGWKAKSKRDPRDLDDCTSSSLTKDFAEPWRDTDTW